ncbi:MAG: hypothetical protein F6K07_33470, partial [Okeania sp. SIO1H5]|uniref:hypothetical protein n=1 Tax=Okeania sp. SIO1H5 TaxID=2607777 RepID=UPI0013B8312F
MGVSYATVQIDNMRVNAAFRQNVEGGAINDLPDRPLTNGEKRMLLDFAEGRTTGIKLHGKISETGVSYHVHEGSKFVPATATKISGFRHAPGNSVKFPISKKHSTHTVHSHHYKGAAGPSGMLGDAGV